MLEGAKAGIKFYLSSENGSRPCLNLKSQDKRPPWFHVLNSILTPHAYPHTASWASRSFTLSLVLIAIPLSLSLHACSSTHESFLCTSLPISSPSLEPFQRACHASFPPPILHPHHLCHSHLRSARQCADHTWPHTSPPASSSTLERSTIESDQPNTSPWLLPAQIQVEECQGESSSAKFHPNP